MKRHLQCAEQQVSRSNLTKYCTCHAESLAYLVLITYETSFRVSGATGVTIQPHQILRLPRKMTRLLYRPHIWNVISNAPSNRCHYPTSPNTAPATKNDTARFQRKSPKTGETSFPMRGRSDHDPSMIREWKRKPQPASQVSILCEVPRSIFYCKIQRFAPNLTVKLSPNTAPATKSDTTTSPSTAPATKSATWTSPSTAPATKNDSTALSSSHMKRHFQCAEQQVSLSNLAKYCACHEKWHCKMSKKISKNRRNVISNAGPIRPWSEHDPSMIREWKRKPQPASQVRLLCEVPRSIFYCKIQRFAPNLTVKLSPNTAPATKSDTTTSPSTAPATKSATWTSPSTAPATKNDSTALSSSHMKRHFQCAEQQVSLSNLAKYCACHEKWHCKMSKKISKNRWNVISNAGPIRPWSDHDPSMIREWKRKPQPASQVRLLCEVPRSIFYCKIQRFAPNLTVKLSPNTAPATKSDTTTSPSTAPATKSATWTSPSTAPATKSDTWTSPSSAPATKSDTWTSPSTAPATSRSMTPTLLDSTRHYSTWLYSTWLYSTRHYSTWLYSTWLYSTRHYSTWLYSTWLYSTRHYSTWLNTWLYSTWHYSTWNYSTWLYSTRHYSTWLNFTEMSFVYRKFLS